jgi:hypothetical protein
VYARIVNNKIVEQDASDHDGESGWVAISDLDLDSGVTLVYDSDTNAVRQKTDAERDTEFDAIVLNDAWLHLRGQRNRSLRDTDAYAVNDRPATTNMPAYRTYLRDLPATYNNVSILSQTDVMDFDAYVASL